MDSFADFDSGRIGNQFVHCSEFPDGVFQGIYEFGSRLDWVEFDVLGLSSHVKLTGLDTSRINGGYRSEHGIRGDFLVTTLDVDCWESRLGGLVDMWTSKNVLVVLGGVG